MKDNKKLIPVVLVSVAITLLVVAIALMLNGKYSLFNRNDKNNSKPDDVIVTPTSIPSLVPETIPDSGPSSVPNVSNNSNDNSASKQIVYTEDDVIHYFEVQDSNISTYQDGSTFKEKAKDTFVDVVDFIFYDRKIKGHTFKELSNNAKLQVIKIAFSVDSRIEKYFPDYKETIKVKYDNLKGKLASLYLEVAASLCGSVGDNTCNQAKDDFNTMKNSFGFTWDLLKELAGSGKNKIKDFYESWRDSE